MTSVESLIQNSQKLTALSGGWPSFHDAEVVDQHLWRGDVKPGDWDDRNVFPVLTIKVKVLEATQPGATHAGHDVLTTLRFHDVNEFKMAGFNHQNRILELSITIQDRGKLTSGESMTPWLVVEFQSGFGMGASFRCFRIEVVDAVRCTEEGNVYANYSLQRSAQTPRRR
ncbi:MAG: immunity 50 family protein [Acidobacteriia bacterium]|nr:immunity 50 family protein [Terriglobia bacterium]